MKSLPADVSAYQRTPEFDEDSVPAGLLRDHRTKASVWGQIHVISGRLRYRILEPEVEEHELTPEHPGIIEPAVLHQVEPLGPVRFYVEFLRKA